MSLAAESHHPAGLPNAGDVIAEKYRVEALLGRGGMGAVFLTRHVTTGKRFAVKVLLPHLEGESLVARFEAEARASATIDHRNVVAVYDVGHSGGLYYMVMEYLEGSTLESHLQAAKQLPLPHALAIFSHVFRGVAAAHAQGIVHRDLKPANIFLCVDAEEMPIQPKVLDFGISKASTGGGGQTESGVTLGTQHYMPLEQALSPNHVTRSADIYALGVILYRCLAGCLPYRADNYAEYILKLNNTDPPRLESLRADLPPGLADEIHRALARRPEDRFPDVPSFARALEPFGFGDDRHPLPVPLGERVLPREPTASGVQAKGSTGGHTAFQTAVPLTPVQRATAGKPGRADPTPLSVPLRESAAPASSSSTVPAQPAPSAQGTPSRLAVGFAVVVGLAGVAAAGGMYFVRRADAIREAELAAMPVVDTVHIDAPHAPFADVVVGGQKLGQLDARGQADVPLPAAPAGTEHQIHLVDDAGREVGRTVHRVRRRAPASRGERTPQAPVPVPTVMPVQPVVAPPPPPPVEVAAPVAAEPPVPVAAPEPTVRRARGPAEESSPAPRPNAPTMRSLVAFDPAGD